MIQSVAQLFSEKEKRQIIIFLDYVTTEIFYWILSIFGEH